MIVESKTNTLWIRGKNNFTVYLEEKMKYMLRKECLKGPFYFWYFYLTHFAHFNYCMKNELSSLKQ